MRVAAGFAIRILPSMSVTTTALRDTSKTFETVSSARCVLTASSSSCRQSRTANGYEIITAENLAGLLDDAGLTADEFAEIGGWSVARVNMWMTGEADMAIVAHLVAVLMSVEENYQDARSLAKARVRVKEGKTDER